MPFCARGIISNRTGYFNQLNEDDVSHRVHRTALTIWVGRLSGRLELASFIR